MKKKFIAILPVLLLMVSVLAAQEKKQAEFGKQGYVMKPQLAGLPHGAIVKELALGVHMPVTSAAAGEPLWAYFFVHNLCDRPRGLDMRFDFITGQTLGRVNSCDFTVKPLANGVTIGPLNEKRTCGCC